MKRITLIGAVVLVMSYLVIRAVPLGEPFAANPFSLQLQVWRFLCGVVTTLAILIAFPLWTWSRELWQEGFNVDAIFSGVEMGAMVAFGAWLFNSKDVFALHPSWETGAVQAVMAALIVCCFVCIALPCALWMAMSMTRLDRIAGRGTKAFEAVAEFQNLRERAQTVGMLSALGIATATLPLGAWRRVVIATDEKIGNSFPPEFVVLFGLYWSFFLALGYVPVYLAGSRAGKAIRDAMVGPRPADLASFGEWQKKRAEIDQFVGMENAPEHFKLVFAVVAPLAGAILSTMVGGS